MTLLYIYLAINTQYLCILNDDVINILIFNTERKMVKNSEENVTGMCKLCQNLTLSMF